MHQGKCLVGAILAIAALGLSPVAAAEEEAEVRGEMLKNTGEVAIRTEDGEFRRPEDTAYKIRERETVVTRTGRAVIRFVDGAMTVLRENSSLRVKEPGWLEQLAGKVMYAVGDVTGSAARRVSSSFATIGIRGTTFIVSEEEGDRNIALREGSLAVESPGEPYEIHTGKSADDFEAFARRREEKKQQMEEEFEEYKQRERKEFIAHVREFKLKAGNTVRFDGQRVSKSGLSRDTEREFEEMAAFAGEHWDEFKAGDGGRPPRDRVDGESERETRERLKLERAGETPDFEKPEFEPLDDGFGNNER